MPYYTIRQKLFSYGGDYYSLKDFQIGEIVAVFEHEQDAKQQFKQLTIDYLNDVTLSQYDVYDLHRPEELQHINQDILKHCGQEILNEYSRLIDCVPTQFSDDDTFYLAQTLGLLPYQLECLNDENYVVWDNHNQCYLRLPDPYGNPFEESDFCGELIWGNSADFLTTHRTSDQFLQQMVKALFPKYIKRHGALAELSDTPDALAQQLEQYPSVWAYSNQTLHPKSYLNPQDFDALQAINTLLKQPYFELRQIDFQNLKDLIDLEDTREVR